MGQNQDKNEEIKDKESEYNEMIQLGLQRQALINQWSSNFSSSGITIFEQLFLPAFENWSIIVELPPIIVYCLEQILDGWSERLRAEISNFNKNSSIMDVLVVANIKLRNKFDEQLCQFDKELTEQGIDTLGRLQNVTSRTWRILKMDVVFVDMIRKIINLYNLQCESISAA